MDLLGIISLSTGPDEKRKPMFNEYWGHGNLQGVTRQDSFCIQLLDKQKLHAGESARAKLKFKFSDDERFLIALKTNDIIELQEGARKIGEFLILEILNPKIIKFK